VAHPPRAVISRRLPSPFIYGCFPPPCSLSLLGSIQLTSPYLPSLTILPPPLSLFLFRDEFSLRISFCNAALSRSRLFFSLFVYRYVHDWRMRIRQERRKRERASAWKRKKRRNCRAEIYIFGYNHRQQLSYEYNYIVHLKACTKRNVDEGASLRFRSAIGNISLSLSCSFPFVDFHARRRSFVDLFLGQSPANRLLTHRIRSLGGKFGVCECATDRSASNPIVKIKPLDKRPLIGGNARARASEREREKASEGRG